MKHIVALSGGKDSTALALRLAEVEPRDYEYVCTPTGNELREMEAHWFNLGVLLGKPIVRIKAPLGLISLAISQKCLPNHHMRWCTKMLKIIPFRRYLIGVAPAMSYVGIRADEAESRDGVDYSKTKGVELRYPLVEWGWDESSVWDYLAKRKVKIPKRTDCALCFYQRLGEWWWLWRDNRKEFVIGEALEGVIHHTFRSESRDSWPAALKELGERFEKGDIPRGAAQQELDLGVYSRSAMCSICAR